MINRVDKHTSENEIRRGETVGEEPAKKKMKAVGESGSAETLSELSTASRDLDVPEEANARRSTDINQVQLLAMIYPLQNQNVSLPV